MGGGKGGKGGGGSVQIPQQLLDISDRLASLSEQTFEISRPGLEAGRDVLQDVIKTGGSGALTPSIRQAVEQTRSGASRAQTATAESLTRAGITGSEAARILGAQRQAGEVAAAQVGPQIALPLVNAAAAQSIGQIAPGLSGLAGAGQLLTPGISRSGGGKGGGGAVGTLFQGLGTGFGSYLGGKIS